MGKTFVAFLAGFAVGTVAGILLAPDKGSVTMENLKKSTDKWADEGLDLIKKFTGLYHNGDSHEQRKERRS